MKVSTLSYVENIRKDAHSLSGAPRDYDPLLDRIGNARFVLIGEASHGTHEFYQQRGEITKRLIAEKQFRAVAVEADWPDAYRINRFVRGYPGDADASEALGDFKRFPTWMWLNADVLDFVGWLRQHNDEVYSLYASIEAVLRYLSNVDPEAARRARNRYACFEH